MARKKSRTLVTYSLDCFGPDPSNGHWHAVMTRWHDKDAIYTVTLTRDSFRDACERARRACIEVDTALAEEQLLLPDNGEFKTQYFGTTST